MRLEYFQMLDRFVDVKADERWIKIRKHGAGRRARSSRGIFRATR